MKALCKVETGKGNVELQDVEKKQIENSDVLINVKAAGICGSDIHIFNWDTQVTMNPPVVMGHEFSGIIEEVGRGVTDWKAGDRVTGEPSYFVCGKCRNCMAGRYNLCVDRRVIGFYTDGAFAEYTIVPSHRLHLLPENISFEEGALTEPLACCVHGVHELVAVSICETVIVTGPGTIGLLAAQVAKAAGASVIMIGTQDDQERLAIAKHLGIDEVINLDQEDPRNRIKNLTNNEGADVALECSGAQSAVNFNFEMLRKGGRYLQLGLFGKPIESSFESIAYKELVIYGSFAQKWSSWKMALKMMAEGKVKLKPIISDIIPLQDWETGFGKMNNKEGLKIILKP